MNEYYDQEYRDVIGTEEDPIPLSRKIWLSWEDLRFQTPKNRGIWGVSEPSDYSEMLQSVWGGAGPGEVVAILGEVRSGKSLLLNILAGNAELSRGDRLTGRVLANGFKRGRRWRRLCSLVTQSQEEYHGLLTIEEQLIFRSELSLPANWSHTKRIKIVEWVLKCLDMESDRHVRIEKLSICQHRRLSIGLALVGLPRILLLDEPTEGLDPTRALELMKTIRKITLQRQITTIITAKQLRESIIPMIDKILLLTQGSTVYYGYFSDARNYFKNRLGVTIPESGDNPLLCMLDAVSCIDCRRDPNHIERIRGEWEAYAFEHQLYRTNYPSVFVNDNDHFVWHRSWFVELREQIKRSFDLLIRNNSYWIGQTLLALSLALIIAFSAFQLGTKEYSIRARYNVLYFTAVFFQFFPFIPFLFVCYRDKWVLRRERRDSMVRVSPAYLAGWLVIYTFRFLIVTLYTCIVYFIVGLRLPFNYTLVFWLTLIAEAWMAMGMGYLIVTFVEDVAVAETVASLILLLGIWFSGDFAFNPSCTWILRWIAYLSPVYYSFNALINNEFDGTGGKGEKVLREVGLNNYGVWPSIGTLLGYGLVYMIIGYFALSYSTRSNRNYI